MARERPVLQRGPRALARGGRCYGHDLGPGLRFPSNTEGAIGKGCVAVASPKRRPPRTQALLCVPICISFAWQLFPLPEEEVPQPLPPGRDFAPEPGGGGVVPSLPATPWPLCPPALGALPHLAPSSASPSPEDAPRVAAGSGARGPAPPAGGPGDGRAHRGSDRPPRGRGVLENVPPSFLKLNLPPPALGGAEIPATISAARRRPAPGPGIGAAVINRAARRWGAVGGRGHPWQPRPLQVGWAVAVGAPRGGGGGAAVWTPPAVSWAAGFSREAEAARGRGAAASRWAPGAAPHIPPARAPGPAPRDPARAEPGLAGCQSPLRPPGSAGISLLRGCPWAHVARQPSPSPAVPLSPRYRGSPGR